MPEARGVQRQAGAAGARGRITLEIPRDPETGFPLLRASEEYHNLNDLVAADPLKAKLDEIIAENRSAEKLLRHGLRPKNRILFYGPPGTGKTLSAKILGSVMGRPFVYVAFDSVISSYLGETATNLRKVFDFIEKDRFVVLFDEFDIVGKKRDDPHEHGEIKRVVNNFMQMLDNSGTASVVVAATNHQQLLDRALWRRFDSVIRFDLPDAQRRRELFRKYLRVHRRDGDIRPDQLARKTAGHSAADIALICEDALKKCIMGDSEAVSKGDVLRAIAEQKERRKAAR